MSIQLEGDSWTPVGPLLFKGNLQAHRGATSWGPITVAWPGRRVLEIDGRTLMEDSEVVQQAWTATGDRDDASLVGLLTIRKPSRGLDPEEYVIRAVKLDPDGLVLATSDELARTEEEPYHANITGSAGGAVAFDIEIDKGAKPTEYIAGRLTGDLSDVSQKIKEPVLAAIFGTVATHTFVPDGKDSHGYAKYCEQVAIIDVSTGAVTTRVNAATYRRAGVCPGLGVDQTHDLAVLSPGIQAVGMANIELGKKNLQFDTASGARLHCPALVEIYDPISGFGVTADTSGRGPAPIRVRNCRTGEMVFELSAKKRMGLSADVEAMVDGVLYIRTTDAIVSIDLSTKEQGSVEVYPRARLGDYLWMNYDSLIPG